MKSPEKLALSRREAARLLGVARGRTLDLLVRAGRLRLVPWGKGWRIPREDCERLAREGWTMAEVERPRRARPRVTSRGRTEAERIRNIDIDNL